MELTYQSILCKLPLPVDDCSGGGNCPITNVAPFDAHAVHNTETLYLAPLETALTAEENGAVLSFLCPTPENGMTELPRSRHRVAVAKNCVNIRSLAAATFETFHKQWRWCMALQQSVMDREGAQALIDRSEELLDDTILLIDLSHRLLAYSHRRPPREGDHAHRYLIENGRHSPETVKRLRASERLAEAESDRNDIIVSDDRSFSDTVTVKRYFRHDGRIYFGAVLLCGYAPYSAGMADLFRVFCGYLNYYAERGYPYERKYTSFDGLLRAVMDRESPATQREQMSICAARCEVPMTGLFDLYRIELREDSAQSPIHILLNFSEALEDARVTSQRGGIVVLNLYGPDGDPEARREHNRDLILRLAGDSVAAIGVSNPFTELHDLGRAYAQAGAALETIRAYHLSDADGAAMLRFENCYIGHLLYSAVRQDAWLYENCTAPVLVRRIRSHDLENGTNYAAILQAFLLNERRPTETGAALGLHRNTIIYHISRMTELFELPLEDPEMRVKLLLSLNRCCLELDGGKLKRK